MKCLLLFSLATILVLTGSLACADNGRPTVKIASFNILRLGQDGYDAKKNWDKTVEIVVQFDIVSLLEVITEDAVQALVEKVETRDGKDWEYVMGPAVGRGSYKERYTFIWRDEDIYLVGGSQGMYPDEGDLLEREPYYATFRAGAFDFALVAMSRTLGLPADAPFTLFAIGRTVGWIAHALEQKASGRPIRPRARYVGVEPGLPAREAAELARRLEAEREAALAALETEADEAV